MDIWKLIAEWRSHAASAALGLGAAALLRLTLPYAVTGALAGVMVLAGATAFVVRTARQSSAAGAGLGPAGEPQGVSAPAGAHADAHTRVEEPI